MIHAVIPAFYQRRERLHAVRGCLIVHILADTVLDSLVHYALHVGLSFVVVRVHGSAVLRVLVDKALQGIHTH